MIKQLKSITEFTKDSILKLINERKMMPKVSDDILKLRIKLCEGCPEYFKAKGDPDDVMRCNKCGCNMKIKHQYEASKCPQGYW